MRIDRTSIAQKSSLVRPTKPRSFRMHNAASLTRCCFVKPQLPAHLESKLEHFRKAEIRSVVLISVLGTLGLTGVTMGGTAALVKFFPDAAHALKAVVSYVGFPAIATAAIIFFIITRGREAERLAIAIRALKTQYPEISAQMEPIEKKLSSKTYGESWMANQLGLLKDQLEIRNWLPRVQNRLGLTPTDLEQVHAGLAACLACPDDAEDSEHYNNAQGFLRDLRYFLNGEVKKV